MWLEEQRRPGTTVNHLGCAAEIGGEVDPSRVEAALGRLLERHEMLRATVVESDSGPVMQITETAEADFEFVDTRGWSAEQVDVCLDEFTYRPYDLAHGPLTRMALLRRDDHVVVSFGMHHLVGDLWSLAQLGTEILDDLAGVTPKRSWRRGFADHVHREQAHLLERADDDRAYWSDVLTGAELALDLPIGDPAVDPADRRASMVAIPLDAARSEAITAAATRLGVTPSAVLLAAFATLLGRYGDRDELCLATARANRTIGNARTVGCVMHPLLLRLDLDPDASFDVAVQSAHRVLSAAMDHGRYPALELITSVASASPVGGRLTPDVGFLWQKVARASVSDIWVAGSIGIEMPVVDHAGLAVRGIPRAARGAPYDLALVGAEGTDAIAAGLEYARGRLDEDDVDLLARQLSALLDAALAEPGRPMRAHSVLTNDELTDLRATWAGPDVEPDPRTLDQLVAASVEANPESVAVVDHRGETSYAQLGDRIERLRRMLTAAGAGHGDLVGMMMDRSGDMVASMLAILRVGAAYVPMDPEFPDDRLTYMAEDAALGLILTDVATRDRVPGGVRRLVVDAAGDEFESPAGESSAGEAMADEAIGPSPSDRAYVIYTSGSTGRPKGVEIEHRQVVNFLRSMAREPGIGPDDVMLAVTTVSFDISMLEIFLPLTCGAAVVIADREAARDVTRLAGVLDSSGITIAQATPTTWRMLVESGWKGSDQLTVLCGGEPLPPDLVPALVERSRILWNMYGPTETTIWSTVHQVRIDDVPPPIGSPIDNTRVYVLDRCRQPLPPGVPGELYIAGDGLARSYLDRPELTAERFVADPFHPGERMYRTGDIARRRVDGTIEHGGRTDRQVKVRGYRIELEEIEHAINRHDAIANSAVATWEPEPGDVRLVAYVTGPGTLPTVAGLRQHLGADLPSYMIPSRVITLDEFPMTPNSKIDRNRLPPIARSGEARDRSPERAAPQPGLEATIASIWREILGVSTLNRHDDFFALGGHSMLATRIASRLRAATHRDVTVRTVFEQPTIAGLAAALGRLPIRPAPTLHSAEGPEAAVLSHAQERMWFLHQYEPEGSAYNIAAAMRLRGQIDIDDLRGALHDLVSRHDALRTTFEMTDVELLQRVDLEADVGIGFADLSTTDADDRFAVAVAAAEADARRPFRLDTGPLLRVGVHRLGAADHVVSLVVHHIVCDQWSLGLIASELSEFYNARREQRDPLIIDAAIQQNEYAIWHRQFVDSRLRNEQLPYWRRQLEGVEALDLSTDRDGQRSSRGAMVRASFTPGQRAAIDRFCRERQVSPFMLFMAVLQAVLARVTGADDVPVATAVANRNWITSESVVSSLVNTLVIRSRVESDDSFIDLLRRVEATTLEAFDHQDLPFATVVSELATTRRTDRQALANVFFNVVNTPIALPTFAGIDTELVPIDRGAAQFDLSLSIDNEISGEATLEYSTDLFDAERMNALLDDFMQVLDSVVSEPDVPVGALPIESKVSGRARAVPTTDVWTRSEFTTELPSEPPRPGVESTIAEAWSRVLDVPELSRHDDFFDLGGHSLLAVRLIIDIERATGRALPVSALFRAPTVASLASEVERPARQVWTSLIPVKPDGVKRPFFYVAPFLITSLSFSDLGRAIDVERPLYVLQPQGVDTADAIHDSVEAMAEHYISEMRQVQPIGPYLIGGHCAGATPAFEVARQLQEAGDEIALLLLVDAEPPHAERPVDKRVVHLGRRIKYYLREGRLLPAIVWASRVAFEHAVLSRFASGRRKALARLRVRHSEAHLRYRPSPIRGGATLIRCAEWSVSPDYDWHLRWGELFDGELRLASVPGVHAVVLTEESERLAEVITEAIDETE